MKSYTDVLNELGGSLGSKLSNRPKLRLKTFQKWKREMYWNLSDEELSTEASRASLAEGSSASYTPDYEAGVGSPRSLALELERKRRKAGISVKSIKEIEKTLRKQYSSGKSRDAGNDLFGSMKNQLGI